MRKFIEPAILLGLYILTEIYCFFHDIFPSFCKKLVKKTVAFIEGVFLLLLCCLTYARDWIAEEDICYER